MKTEQVTEAESAALEEEACHLTDKLNELFDRHSLVAIAAAMHAVIEGDPKLRSMVKLQAAAECDCPDCIAERAAKRGQA